MTEFQREIAPRDALEDRVVAALKARGLIRPSRPSRIGIAGLAAAAALLLFAAGFAAGAWPSRGAQPPVTAGPRFMLLLHETAATASTGLAEQALVDEYREWARGVAATGRAIHGEKLKPAPGQTLSGFFVVEAPSLDAARAIAASSPHVRHGGRIEVREIDPT